MPIVLVILGFSIALFFVDLGELNIKINSVNFNSDTLFSKTLLVISALNYLLIIAALYFFRKILNYFIRVKIFEETVIKSLKKQEIYYLFPELFLSQYLWLVKFILTKK